MDVGGYGWVWDARMEGAGACGLASFVCEMKEEFRYVPAMHAWVPPVHGASRAAACHAIIIRWASLGEHPNGGHQHGTSARLSVEVKTDKAASKPSNPMHLS